MMSAFLQDLVMLLVLEDSKDYDIRDTSVLSATSWPNSHDERHDDSLRKVPIQSRRSQKSRINKWHRSWPQQPKTTKRLRCTWICLASYGRYLLTSWNTCSNVDFEWKGWILHQGIESETIWLSISKKIKIIWRNFDANFGHLHPKAPIKLQRTESHRCHHWKSADRIGCVESFEQSWPDPSEDPCTKRWASNMVTIQAIQRNQKLLKWKVTSQPMYWPRVAKYNSLSAVVESKSR